MSAKYNQGVPYGIPDYNSHSLRPAQRRPPPAQLQPGKGTMNYPVRPQQVPALQPPTSHLYHGSDFGGAEEEDAQWPLPARTMQQHGPRGPSPQAGRGPPPPRPQRPDYVPPVLDPPRPPVAPAQRQYQQRPPLPQALHIPGQWTGHGYSAPYAHLQPPPSRPMPQPSRSAVHSNRNIPDPLVPQIPHSALSQQNRRPPLGPPPSARRGPSSYYPQMAPVHPIVEETDSARGSVRTGGAHDSKGSYASSNAIPIGIPDYYLENNSSTPSMSVYDEDPPPPMPTDLRASGQGSRLTDQEESDEDTTDEADKLGLVRQASLGKRSKPTLTTIKIGDNLRTAEGGAVQGVSKGIDSPRGISGLPSQRSNEGLRQIITPMERYDDGPSRTPQVKRSMPNQGSYKPDRFGNGDKELEAGGAPSLAAFAVAAPMYKHRNESSEKKSTRTPNSEILGSGTGLLDPSSSESEQSIKTSVFKEMLGADSSIKPSHSRSPLPAMDPRVAQMLGNLEKGGALSPKDANRLKSPNKGFSDRASRRRPPRLDVDAVRDAEARGSLTSLPDLIKRATRLASNLDRGKTASRLGMNWLDGADSDDEKHRPGLSDHRRSGSFTDILASFPPPALATPPGSRGGARRSLTQWPSNLMHSHLPSESDAGEIHKRRRRCCGLPLRLFLLLLVVLILLIAAAIIVPVVLIVVPKHNGSTAKDSLATCQSSLTCQNGGTNTVRSDGHCHCVCVNEFTGTQCTTSSNAACSTTSVGGTNDATVGNEIPRLLSGSNANFSVPLDGPTLLALFSASNLSCTSENALVSFNGLTTRSILTERASYELALLSALKRPLPPVALEIPTQTMNRRQAASSAVAATSNGIVSQSGAPPTATATPQATATPPLPGAIISSVSLDFARVAVLYVFQTSAQMGYAVTAQENLQSYYTSGTTSSGGTINPANVSLGNGVTCDVTGHSIVLGNGTSVGGGGGGS